MCARREDAAADRVGHLDGVGVRDWHAIHRRISNTNAAVGAFRRDARPPRHAPDLVPATTSAQPSAALAARAVYAHAAALDANPGLTRAEQEAPEPAVRGTRADLLRDVRRIWMSARFRRQPCAILVAAIRTTGSAATPSAAIIDRLRVALSEFGTVYDTGPARVAVVMPDVALHHAAATAEALADTIRAHNVGFGAGVAALHQDDDPSTAVARADSCLRLALASPRSRVVAETDPGRLHRL